MTNPKPKASAGPTRSAKGRAQDDQVMGTNNSSIVSKRSVEKLYYPHEPHFFRYFVKKFQRRSPLINRGYHLRLHVIDVTVRNFLRKEDGKPKVVINLGCGYDVLPWQTWTQYPEDCRDVKFLDIDFPDLMGRKRTTVLGTEELKAPLTNLVTPEGGSVLLKSDRYAQIGCDLRNLEAIRTAISELVDIEACSFLFVAEVSVTYMETVAADALIEWASGLGQSEFCLLEQILPDGPDHPFAKTMLSHFDKLSTPIKSVHRYQTIQDQRDRFLSRGWRSIKAWNLWQAWADDAFLSSEDRRKLDEVEPFDEWEEFALFGAHYCIINAGNYSSFGPQESPNIPEAELSNDELDSIPDTERNWAYQENPGTKGQRRFGAAMKIRNLQGQDIFANVMGLGPSSRLSSSDLYHEKGDAHCSFPSSGTGPSSRMCHTITSLGPVGELLVGGRTSPTNPMKDCWLFGKGTQRWERTHDLPIPLYRHSVTRLGSSSFALVMGGKTGPSKIFDGWLLYHPEKGWLECKIRDGTSEVLDSVFGATLIFTKGSYPRWEGYLAGGMGSSGVIADQILHWTLDMDDLEIPTISFASVPSSEESSQDMSLINRFGAACLQNGNSGEIMIIGGIVKDHLLPYETEITLWNPSKGTVRPPSDKLGLGSRKQPAPRRALLVGHSALLTKYGQVAILGGGATCFSMGTCWNKGPYTLNFPDEGHKVLQLDYRQTVEILPQIKPKGTAEADFQGLSAPKITPIPQVSLQSAADFDSILRKGEPVVLKNLDLGSCVTQWNLNYIADKAGAERKVVVHQSSTQSMDFNAKNFQYVTKTFAEFADEVQKGGRLYLRALSTEEPADRPANLADDYPTLSEDFTLPAELSFVQENTFSSVLRISGPVNMWLHYDVMANVYCQIQGSKRLLLFPPTDVEHLSFAPGASSSSIDVFSKLDSPSLGRTQPHEAILEPGDVLFIPPLWLHTATPTSDSSIAVNVFFRDLENGYSSGRDVYGNRDLAAYEKGRQDINRLVNSFQKLPAQARDFYLLRLADELRQKIQS